MNLNIILQINNDIIGVILLIINFVAWPCLCYLLLDLSVWLSVCPFLPSILVLLVRSLVHLLKCWLIRPSVCSFVWPFLCFGSLVGLCIRLLVGWVACLIGWFVRSLVGWLVRPSVRLATRSFVRSEVTYRYRQCCSPLRPPVRSFVHSSVRPSVHSFVRSEVTYRYSQPVLFTITLVSDVFVYSAETQLEKRENQLA